MFRLIAAAACLAVCGQAFVAAAGQVPTSKSEVAVPGGDLPGDPEIALVKVADGSAPGFLHALDNQPLEFEFRTDQELTPEVRQFYRTRINPYRSDSNAVEVGRKLYRKWRMSCHLKDGTGRLGPNLVDEKWMYERTLSDQGKFEIIYGGGAGAMQAFGRRMDQDDILKVMA